MLDYAANALSYWNVEAIKARVERGREMSDASEAVAERLEATSTRPSIGSASAPTSLLDAYVWSSSPT